MSLSHDVVTRRCRYTLSAWLLFKFVLIGGNGYSSLLLESVVLVTQFLSYNLVYWLLSPLVTNAVRGYSWVMTQSSNLVTLLDVSIYQLVTLARCFNRSYGLRLPQPYGTLGAMGTRSI